MPHFSTILSITSSCFGHAAEHLARIQEEALRRGIHLGNGVGTEPKNAFIFVRDDREHVTDRLTFLPVQAASAKKTIAKKVATKKTTPKKAKK